MAKFQNAQTSALFSKLAGGAAEAMGSPTAFLAATAACLLWGASGPYFHYSDTWQLVINTATTVLTFLAVFLIQHSQNRDGRAIQLKLDELILSSKAANNRLINLEHCSDEEFREIQERIRSFKNRDSNASPQQPME